MRSYNRVPHGSDYLASNELHDCCPSKSMSDCEFARTRYECTRCEHVNDVLLGESWPRMGLERHRVQCGRLAGKDMASPVTNYNGAAITSCGPISAAAEQEVTVKTFTPYPVLLTATQVGLGCVCPEKPGTVYRSSPGSSQRSWSSRPYCSTSQSRIEGMGTA